MLGSRTTLSLTVIVAQQEQRQGSHISSCVCAGSSSSTIETRDLILFPMEVSREVDAGTGMWLLASPAATDHVVPAIAVGGSLVL